MTTIPVTTGMNYGFPGTVAESPENVIKSFVVNSNSGNITFGTAAIFNADFSVTAAGSTATMSNFAGIAVRQIQTNTASFLSPNTGGVYVAGTMAEIMKRGTVAVNCQLGTPTALNGVYLRIATNSSLPTMVVGGFEAESAADGSNTILLTNARWCSGKDANGTATIELVTPANA
jgi:hypothetical protein